MGIGEAFASALSAIAANPLRAHLAAASAGWPVLIEPAGVGLAVGFSALVGVFFSFDPARRAATLDPIAALRREWPRRWQGGRDGA
ncbi:ABC transporter permease [Elioraea sp.]|uniref:ABC transporter permease n=1 Tax=Elioraea sp. TaxID=2185103 RepID=UPI0025BD9D3A|nr:ABC transporter permease [Elioraea sp.]